MKTLWLIPSFRPALGGIETAGLQLAQGLQAKGHELLIVTDEGYPAAPDEEVVAGLPVARLPVYRALTEPSPRLLLKVAQRLVKLAAEFQPDLLHLHLVGHAPMGLFGLRLRESQPVPLLLTVHDDVHALQAGVNTVLGRCFQVAEWITTLSQTFMMDVLRLAPDVAERSSIIYPGLTGPVLKPISSPVAAPEFLCLGRLSHEKGLDLALTAFAKVVQTHASIRLVIAGDGPVRPALERQAVELGLSERIVFTGRVSDEERDHLFDRALAVVMPSRHREGFGLVALEAAQHGRAVIAARAGALSETVSLLGNGLLIPQEDATALATAMSQLLLHPDDAQRMGDAGQAQAFALFSQEACTHSYEALYRRLAKGSRHSLDGSELAKRNPGFSGWPK